MRLFISHAVADKELVDAVITLLEMGAGVSTQDIFCTSFDEHGIPAGTDFAPYMRQKLEDAEAILAIVTPQYYDSPFCLCETGGAWATQKKFLPLLVEPVGYGDLRGALYGKQGLLITDSGKLDALRDELSMLGNGKTTRWNRKKEDFLKALPALLKKMKPVATLRGTDAEKLRGELRAARAEAEELDRQNEELQKQIEGLKHLKDAEAVKEFLKTFSTEDEQFEQLVKTARSAIHRLPRCVREAMLFHVRHDNFNPEYEQWGNNISEAIQRNYLKDNSEELYLNEEHPVVEEALDAFNALAAFEHEATPEFKKSYRDDYEENLDVTSRTFWDDHKLFF